MPKNQWNNFSWSVVSRDDRGAIEETVCETRDQAFAVSDKYVTSDKGSKAETMVIRNGRVIYKRLWRSKYGRWAKPLAQQQKAQTGG